MANNNKIMMHFIRVRLISVKSVQTKSAGFGWKLRKIEYRTLKFQTNWRRQLSIQSTYFTSVCTPHSLKLKCALLTFLKQ